MLPGGFLFKDAPYISKLLLQLLISVGQPFARVEERTAVRLPESANPRGHASLRSARHRKTSMDFSFGDFSGEFWLRPVDYFCIDVWEEPMSMSTIFNDHAIGRRSG